VAPPAPLAAASVAPPAPLAAASVAPPAPLVAPGPLQAQLDFTPKLVPSSPPISFAVARAMLDVTGSVTSPEPPRLSDQLSVDELSVDEATWVEEEDVLTELWAPTRTAAPEVVGSPATPAPLGEAQALDRPAPPVAVAATPALAPSEPTPAEPTQAVLVATPAPAPPHHEPPRGRTLFPLELGPEPAELPADLLLVETVQAPARRPSDVTELLRAMRWTAHYPAELVIDLCRLSAVEPPADVRVAALGAS